MYEVSQPLLSALQIVIFAIGRHVKGALANEGLRVGWHVGEIVHYHKHFDNCAQRIEQRHLHRATLRHIVPFLSQIYVTLKHRKKS